MIFNIIEISETEFLQLNVVQQKLIRTAQQKKNELAHKMENELSAYKQLLYSNGMINSTLYAAMEKELSAEFDYQVEILREQLIYNLTIKEPTNDGETGGSGSDNSSYPVDYELSYLERYVLVRDFYLTIEDPVERLNLLAADTVAMEYLGSYYNSLFNYLASFT